MVFEQQSGQIDVDSRLFDRHGAVHGQVMVPHRVIGGKTGECTSGD